jgi:hypothetical protein
MIQSESQGSRRIISPVGSEGQTIALVASALERHSRLHLKRPRRYKVRPAERREEIVERDLDASEAKRHLRVFSTEQIICADAEVEQAAWSDARRICVIVLFAVSWNHYAQGTTISRTARQDWRCGRGESGTTEKTNLGLLIRTQAERGIEIRN